jgi:hypothetical protein
MRTCNATPSGDVKASGRTDPKFSLAAEAAPTYSE